MKRTMDLSGTVHFIGANGCTLCGVSRDVTTDLFRAVHTLTPETSESVTCPECARLYCAIKNAPWHEVADAAMEHGMAACGDKVWCGACGNKACPDCGKDFIVPCARYIKEGVV